MAWHFSKDAVDILKLCLPTRTDSKNLYADYELKVFRAMLLYAKWLDTRGEGQPPLLSDCCVTERCFPSSSAKTTIAVMTIARELVRFKLGLP